MLPEIKSPWIFYGAAILYIGYVIYMMVRRRRNRRAGREEQEPII